MATALELIVALDRFIEATKPIVKKRLLAPIERKLETAMKYAFALQGRAFLKHFARLEKLFPTETIMEALALEDWEPLFNQADVETIEAFVKPIDSAVEAALLAGGKQTMADFMLTGSFDLANPRAVAYLKDYGAKLVKGINETTRTYIKTIVTEGVEQGWSYNKTAKAISDRYEEFRIGMPQKHIQSRAHLVAVQESAQAYESGNMIVAQDLKDAGLDIEKSWLTVGDDRVSEECRANQAQEWIPLDQAFSSGVANAPGHVACRCTTLYQRKGLGVAEFKKTPTYRLALASGSISESKHVGAGE